MAYGQENLIILEIIRLYQMHLRTYPTKRHIHNAFYLAHLYYTKLYSGYLSDHPIMRGDAGPEIDNLDGILVQLQAESATEMTICQDGVFKVEVYHARQQPTLPSNAITAIREAVLWAGVDELGTAQKIQFYSHSWQETKDNAEMQRYFVDLLTAEEYANLKAEATMAKAQIVEQPKP